MRGVRTMKKPLTVALAVLVLVTALVMAAVAAWQRADTSIDRALLVALGCVTVCAVHLLPALTKRRMMWPLWAGCFLMAVYGHAGFFAFATVKAGDARAANSAQAKAVQAQRQTITDTLATIKARPLSQVALQLSRTHDGAKREALEIELGEAKRAAALRDELVRLEAVTADNVTVTDPVVMQLVTVTGASERAVMLVLNLVMAGMLELVGVVLWLELTNGGELAQGVARDAPTEAPSKPLAPIDRLRDAIDAGQCRPTVADIRRFMACAQGKAQQLRREL
jgi:hypothetical protein